MGKKNKTKNKSSEKSSKKTMLKLEKKVLKMEKATEDECIETLLENFKHEQQKLTEVTVTASSPPSPRSHFSFVSSPESHELFLYGGEYYDGKKISMFSDLFIYNCRTHSWELVTSPTTPPPRSGHQALYIKTSNVPASICIFGGEYASPNQVRFHHYNDLWCLRVRTRKWQQIKTQGFHGPCARSGHRMLLWKNSVLLFGGFSDTGSKTIYFNDLWSFDLCGNFWTQIKLSGDVPIARSGCLLFLSSDTRFLYICGGYRKEQVARGIEHGVAISELLRINLENETLGKSTLQRASGVRPKPPRSAMAGVLQSSNRALVFGGVHDVESEDGETVTGYFHNDLLTIDLDKSKWFPFTYATSKQSVDSFVSGCLSPPAPLQSPKPSGDTTKLSDGIFTLTLQNEVKSTKSEQSLAPDFVIPSPRASPGMALLDSTLYVYGGVFEVGDRKLTLDDFYCLDLNQPVSWKCLYPGTQSEQKWLGSEDEGEMDTDSSTDEDEEEEEGDDDDELQENAPIPASSENLGAYWDRTKLFWHGFVTRSLNSDSTCAGPSKLDSAAEDLSLHLATNFYEKHSSLKL